MDNGIGIRYLVIWYVSDQRAVPAPRVDCVVYMLEGGTLAWESGRAGVGRILVVLHSRGIAGYRLEAMVEEDQLGAWSLERIQIG